MRGSAFTTKVQPAAKSPGTEVYKPGQCPACFRSGTWNGKRCSHCGAVSS